MSQDDMRKYFTPVKSMLGGWSQHLEGSMVENFESYMTPDGSNNTTQFFSVLEESGTETIMHEMSHIDLAIDEGEFTFSNSNVNMSVKDAETQNDDDENQNLVIFKVPNSGKMYGLQTAQDEDGNLQKYQYEVIVNKDQQFETVPDTIKLVSLDTDPMSVVNQIEEDELALQDNDDEDEIEETARIYIKEEFLQEQEELEHVKDELYITPDDTYINDIQNEEHIVQLEHKLDNIHVDFNESEHLQDILTEESCSTASDLHEEQDPEDVPVKKEILKTALKGIYLPEKDEAFDLYYNEESESSDNTQDPTPEPELVHFSKIENGERRTIALYSISKDTVCQDKPKAITTIQLPNKKTSGFIKTDLSSPLKSLNTLKRTTAPADGDLSPQKENQQANNSSTVSFIRKQKPLVKETKPAMADTADGEKKIDAKKKQIGPWNVNKMISQTTIIEAPVRQERLPRKQKIEPLSRVGDELVFQHVIVSANGVVETKVDGVVKERKVLQPSECIQLSDSDEDAIRIRKRHSRKKPVEIVISDSEEELVSDGLITEATQTSITECDSTAVQTSSDVIISNKPTNDCTKCSKSFPSIGSLKTHLQHHTFEESKKKHNGKYRCGRCNETFINNFLLSKHEQMHNSKNKYECFICYKLLSNQKELNVHKRIHVNNETLSKQNVIAGTTQKSTRKSCVDTRNSVNVNASRKSQVPQMTNGRSLPASRKNTILLNANRKSSSNRKSLTLPTTKRKSSSANPTRKTLIPSNTNRKSTFKKPLLPSQTTRPTNSSSSKPTTSGISTSQFITCNSCHAEFSNKIDLDTHVIKNCVKSPRRLSSVSTLRSSATLPRRTISCSNTKQDQLQAPTKSNITTSVTTRSSKLYLSRNAESMNQINSSRDNLNTTLNSTRMSQSISGSKSNLNVTIGSAKRTRIPANAGITVSRMKLPFLNMKRKLTEDA